MEVKSKGDVVKVRLTAEDLGTIGSSLVWPILQALAKERPDLVRPIKGWKVELVGEIYLTLAGAEELLGGGV